MEGKEAQFCLQRQFASDVHHASLPTKLRHIGCAAGREESCILSSPLGMIAMQERFEHSPTGIIAKLVF